MGNSDQLRKLKTSQKKKKNHLNKSCKNKIVVKYSVTGPYDAAGN